MSVQPPLVAAYKGAAGGDVLLFGRTWSQSSGRPLQVVTVYPGPAPIGLGRVDAEWVAYNREEAGRILGEAREQLGPDVEATFRPVAADSAAHGLHDVMEEGGPDTLVIVGSRKTKEVRRTAPGSTADRLLQGAPGPVAIVPWDYELREATPITTVTVAFVDIPDGRAALAASERMATELGAQLKLVSVLPDTRVQPSLGEPQQFAREQREQFQARLDEVVAGLPAALRTEVRVLEGPVVDALTDIHPEDTDVLVCGSRGYGPARRVLLGGVSSRLLRHARVPVIIVPKS